MTPKTKRPFVLPSVSLEMPCPCGKIYIHITFNEGKIFEIFTRLGKQGGCACATTAGLAVTASLAIRSGANPLDIAKGLIGISCHRSPVFDGPPCEENKVRSCVDAIGRGIREYCANGNDEERLEEKED
jgi:ribonucleoside-diphosphate reductase alpha chain